MNTTYNDSPSMQKGFTLIELLITVAIIGVLLAVAIPGYNNYMENTRRLDAKAFLQEVAGEQVRFFSDNNRYATTLKEMGYSDDTMDSPDGFYNLSIANDVPTSFTLTAAVVPGKAQESDTKCGNFTLDSTGLKGVTGTSDVDTCW